MSLQQILLDADVKKPIALDVALAIDCSGSMSEEFADGTVAKLVSYIQEFAKLVDDDAKIETIGFNINSTKINTLNVNNNVSDFITKNYRAGGGTSYATAISNLISAVDHNLPSIVFVITDGENNDTEDTRKVLSDAQANNPKVYVHFIRAGTEALKIKFIEEVANELSNIGYSDFPNVRADSEVFFKSLVTNELTTFLNSIS